MLDFTLIENGEEFEQLCEEILIRKGIEIISKPFRGPDYGVDILASVIVTDKLGIKEKHRVLVECKNFAKSNRSVRESDIGNVIERAMSNNCNKYLLITSTTVSSVISHQLEGITNNPSIPLSATFWAKNDLDKIIHEFTDIKERYFLHKKISLKHKSTVLNEEPRINLGIHSHPDFAHELEIIIDIWNNNQKHVLFSLIRARRELETQLISSGSISEKEASYLANEMRKEAGFSEDDSIIQFCEKRLYGGPYHQLFASGTDHDEVPPNTATISLKFMRLLADNKKEKQPAIHSMIIQSILHVISTGIGLNAHDETRGCIMDFDNNMSDILYGLENGPKYCNPCKKQITRMGAKFLFMLANSSREYLNSIKTDSKTLIRMELREKRKELTGDKYDFDIALSFAGEDRDKAESLANALKERNINVFYDAFQKAELWGQDLYSYLSDLYRFRAKYCVVFVSEQYSKKLWTNHERKSAQERAFKENQTYILPIRIDNTEIPGLLSTVGYLNWNNESVTSIVNLIINKLENDRITATNTQ